MKGIPIMKHQKSELNRKKMYKGAYSSHNKVEVFKNEQNNVVSNHIVYESTT